MSTRFTGCTHNLWPVPDRRKSSEGGRKPPLLVNASRFHRPLRTSIAVALKTALKTLDLRPPIHARFGTPVAFLSS